MCREKKIRPKLSLLVTKHGRVNNDWDASTVAMGAKGTAQQQHLLQHVSAKGGELRDSRIC
jgi:hypothetical protein